MTKVKSKELRKETEILADKIANPSAEMIISNLQGQLDGYKKATEDILEIIFCQSKYAELLRMLERLSND